MPDARCPLDLNYLSLMLLHHRAAILAVGDELILGQSLDTNSRWIADRLASLGIQTIEHATVPDDRDAIAAALRRLAAAAPLVISTGGLGPTPDDLTRVALADVLSEPLIADPAAQRDLQHRFAALGRTPTEAHLLQARRPLSAEMLPNATGSAPGLHATLADENTDVFCLPGPPREMQPMFDAHVAPRLHPNPAVNLRTRSLHVCGLAEAHVAQRIAHMLRRDRNPAVGTTVSGAIVTVRLRATASAGAHAADLLLDADDLAIRDALAPFLFGSGGDTIAASLLRALSSRAETLCTVESCTGGLLGADITAVPGSSAVYLGGLITYSNDLKTSLVGVDPALIRDHGAVSRDAALALALGGLIRTGAAHALSITGIAGPDGGTTDKPVGTVWIAHAHPPAAPDARLFRFPGSRDDIRERAARTALALCWLSLQSTDPPPPLLWQLH